jgi:hypothetical protein
MTVQLGHGYIIGTLIWSLIIVLIGSASLVGYGQVLTVIAKTV